MLDPDADRGRDHGPDARHHPGPPLRRRRADGAPRGCSPSGAGSPSSRTARSRSAPSTPATARAATARPATPACARGFAGRQTGTIGAVGCYSFFPSKNLGAFGDAGLHRHRRRRARDRGAPASAPTAALKKYHNETVGYNSRLDALQAALLRVKLPHVAEANAGRRAPPSATARCSPDVAGVVAPEVTPGHVFHQYTVRIAGGRRDAVHDALAAAGIQTMVYYPVPIHRLPVYAACRLPRRSPSPSASPARSSACPSARMIAEADQARVGSVDALDAEATLHRSIHATVRCPLSSSPAAPASSAPRSSATSSPRPTTASSTWTR